MAENASTDGGMSGSQGDSASGGDSDSRADARSGSTADTRAGAEAQAHESGSGWGFATNDLTPIGEAITGTPAEMADVAREMQDQSNAANVGPRSSESSSLPTIASVLGRLGVPKGLASLGGMAIGAAVPALGAANAMAGMANLGMGAAKEVGGLIGSTRNEVNAAAGYAGNPAPGREYAGGSSEGGLIGLDANQAPTEASPVAAIAANPSVDYTMLGHVDQSGWGRAISGYVSKKQGVAS